MIWIVSAYSEACDYEVGPVGQFEGTEEEVKSLTTRRTAEEKETTNLTYTYYSLEKIN